MVRKDIPAYLFIGQDSRSKDLKLKRIKEELLPAAVADFNLDVLYARELNLFELQEKLLSLPCKAKKRIIVIKNLEDLKKEELRNYLLKYLKNPQNQILLILDVDQRDPKDEFIRQLSRYSKVFHFQEQLPLDAFTLSRQIELKKPASALRVLNLLLEKGERPERILGGLRYAWERNFSSPQKVRKALKILLNCDIDIKTGRIKPPFALEKLVVRLCYL